MNRESNGTFSAKDLTGKRFGMLVALAPLGINKFGYREWECVCDCGNTKTASAQVLLKTERGQRGIKSCGCMRKGRPCKSGNAVLNSIYCSRKSSAKSRGISWNLTREQAFKIFKAPCIYCGASPAQKYHNSSCVKGVELYNGIDRLNSAKGYEISNCAPCCGDCNTAKMEMSVGQFKEWIERVHANIKNWERYAGH